MRRRYVYDKAGNAIEVTDMARVHVVHEVMPDIGRFRSPIDGSVIEGRRQYENHLRRHDCRIVEPSEVAPEKISGYRVNYDHAPEQRKELIRSQIDRMTQKEFKAALQRDIDKAKWNSNY